MPKNREPLHSLTIVTYGVFDPNAYTRVSIAFETSARVAMPLALDACGRPHLAPLGERRIKDYDALEGNHPREWVRLLRESTHVVFQAYVADTPVGGAIAICRAASIDLLDDRSDVALLWDLRVAPSHRGMGVGAMLWDAAESWTTAHDCSSLRVETQDFNPAAVRFYLERGCQLLRTVPDAYAEAPEETQLLFEKSLGIAR